MTILLITIGILIFLILIAAIVRSPTVYYNDYDDEVVTTTHTTVTTTTDTPQATIGLNVNGIPVVGIIERQWENNQPFVIDPVDGDKMWLNTNDDLYEDGGNKVWGLK